MITFTLCIVLGSLYCLVLEHARITKLEDNYAKLIKRIKELESFE